MLRPTRRPRMPAPARHGISRGHHLPSRRHRPPWRPVGPLEVFHHSCRMRQRNVAAGEGHAHVHAGGWTPGAPARRRRARSGRARRAAPRPPAVDRRSAPVSDVARTADRDRSRVDARDRGCVGDRPPPVQPVVALGTGVGGPDRAAVHRAVPREHPAGTAVCARARHGRGRVDLEACGDGPGARRWRPRGHRHRVRRPDRARPGDRRRTVAPHRHRRGRTIVSATSSWGVVRRSSMERFAPAATRRGRWHGLARPRSTSPGPTATATRT